MFKFIKNFFQTNHKPESSIDKAIRLYSDLPKVDSIKVYSSDLCSCQLSTFYSNVGAYIDALRYIMNCFEYHRFISSYYVTGKTQKVYLPSFFTIGGNYILEIDETLVEFSELSKSFLSVYQEAENNLKDTENSIIERNLQMTRQIVNDLVQLADQLSSTMA